MFIATLIIIQKFFIIGVGNLACMCPRPLKDNRKKLRIKTNYKKKKLFKDDIRFAGRFGRTTDGVQDPSVRFSARTKIKRLASVSSSIRIRYDPQRENT